MRFLLLVWSLQRVQGKNELSYSFRIMPNKKLNQDYVANFEQDGAFVVFVMSCFLD